MRLVRWSLAVCLALSCASPLHDAAPPARDLVVGEGNRVSGDAAIAWLGDPAHPFAAAVDAVARTAAERGLRVPRAAWPLDPRRPPPAVLATPWPPAPQDAAALAAYVRAGHGLVVLVDAELDADARPLGVTSAPTAGSPALYVVDPHPPAAWGDAPRVLAWPEESGAVHVLAAGPGTDPVALATTALRHAIVRAEGVTYLPSAFGEITAHADDGKLVVSAPTLLPGKVTMDVVTIEGASLLRPGPVRPIDLAQIPDLAGALLRLRFAGRGVADEARVGLRDLTPHARAVAQATGFAVGRAGDPVAFRVVLADRDGTGVEGCAVEAMLGDVARTAVTDAAGTALLAFPAPDASKPRIGFSATVRGPGVERTLETEVRQVQRAARGVVQIDRPVYRPGGIVKLRAFVLGGDDRPVAGTALTVEVRDPRDRLLRTFAGRTDDFGVLTCEMPLAARIAEGAYVARVRGDGIDARTRFVVEDAARLPFEVSVALDHPRVAVGDRLTGSVTVRDWDGVPVRGAKVHVDFGRAATDGAGDGAIAFDLGTTGVPPGQPITLRVEVESAGAVIASETSVVLASRRDAGREELAIEVAPTAAPGCEVAIMLHAKQREGVVDVDLAGPQRLVAATSMRLADGVATARLSIPSDAQGPAQVIARIRGGATVRAPLTLGRPLLDVALDASPETAPGADVDARIRVRSRDGRGVPALLDVRGADRAYSEDLTPLDPRDGDADDVPGAPAVLATDDERGAWTRLEARADAAAAEALGRAVADAAAGRPVRASLPWGAPLFAGTFAGSLCVGGDGPVTCRAGGGNLPQRFVRRVADATGTERVAEMLPREVPTRPGTELRPGRWLVNHQSPDGSWDPVQFVDLCWSHGCEGIGPSELRIASTSLALLCFLGAGETHQSGASRETVKSGLRWLRERQRPDGFVGDRAAPCAALNHALAALALCEAYGMTGSRFLKSPAQRAIDALAAMQHPDGSFAEAGMHDGSVILGTFAVMALKSALLSELDIDKSSLDRYVAWLDAHTDEATGAPSVSAEEVAAYPFGSVHARRTAAAGSMLCRIFAGATPGAAPVLRRAEATVLADLPSDVTRDDPVSVYFGTLAMFQMGQPGWKTWNEAMKTAVIDRQEMTRDHCSRGSWADRTGRAGRLLSTELNVLDMEVYYRYGRVLGSRQGGGAATEPTEGVRVRSDFPDLLVSDLALRTDEHGERALRLHVPDQVTTWDLAVGAWDREGRYGVATGEVRASLPLFATIGLPPRLRRGDVVRVPIAVRSTLDTIADCTIEVTRVEGLELVEAPPAAVRVAAGATFPAFATWTVTGPSQAVLEVTVRGGGRADAVRAVADVAPTSRPFAASVPVRVGAPARLAVRGATDARAVLRLRGSVTAAATSSLAALLQRPHGCFEQVSATLHPALLAWRCLGASADDPRIAFLRDGYQQILAFEAPGGGFALWPGAAPRTDLTALGIHELLDLDPVLGVDREVLRRAGEFLATHLSDDPAERLFALGALRRMTTRAEAELPALGEDPYLLALALTQDLLDGDASRQALATLRAAARRNAEGQRIWRSAAKGLHRGAAPRDTETTALAVEALARRGDDLPLAREGLETLRASVLADGAWGDTRETVAVLRALLAVSAESAKGRVVAEVKGRAPLAADLGADLVEIDLGPWTDADELTLRFEGAGTPWATLAVRGSTDGAAEEALATPLSLAVAWPAAALRRGAKGVVRVEVANVSAGDVTSPLVVLPLPGGIAVDRGALERAALAAGFSFAEIEDGAVHLYAPDLPRGAARTLDLPFTARCAGSFSTGPASAAPYYEPEAAAWTPSCRVEVRGE